MHAFSRRNFLFASSGAAAGSLLVSGLAEAAEDAIAGADFSSSGLVTGTPKPLPFKSIPGFLSAEQIAPHHTAHYGGALKSYSDLDSSLEKAFKEGTKIDALAYGNMQRSKVSKGNSVLLHELYFDGLTAKAGDPGVDIRPAIEKRFGTLDRWLEDLQASAKEAAGWAMLVVHPANGKLYNVVSDEHAIGVLWMAVPIVVIDTYEHAYYIDYQNRKAEYVSKFPAHIDWQAANSRYREALQS